MERSVVAVCALRSKSGWSMVVLSSCLAGGETREQTLEMLFPLLLLGPCPLGQNLFVVLPRDAKASRSLGSVLRSVTRARSTVMIPIAALVKFDLQGWLGVSKR